MLIRSLVIFLLILLVLFLWKNKQSIFIQDIRYLELLSIFSRIKMTRRIGPRKQETLKPALEWAKFQQLILIKWLQIPKEDMILAKGKKVLSKAIREM